mmetsp:Transcript_46714/g.109936  ORF Transcript_46714/g.109936 Transcript_46714/m.109936 type:complete len:223 (-) Transcript_46714:222-890(-)
MLARADAQPRPRRVALLHCTRQRIPALSIGTQALDLGLPLADSPPRTIHLELCALDCLVQRCNRVGERCQRGAESVGQGAQRLDSVAESAGSLPSLQLCSLELEAGQTCLWAQALDHRARLRLDAEQRRHRVILLFLLLARTLRPGLRSSGRVACWAKRARGSHASVLLFLLARVDSDPPPLRSMCIFSTSSTSTSTSAVSKPRSSNRPSATLRGWAWADPW